MAKKTRIIDPVKKAPRQVRPVIFGIRGLLLKMAGNQWKNCLAARPITLPRALKKCPGLVPADLVRRIAEKDGLRRLAGLW